MRSFSFFSKIFNGFRIKSLKGAVAVSMIIHAAIITGLTFSGAGTDMLDKDKFVLEEMKPVKEHEVTYVNLEPEITESEVLAAAPSQPDVAIQGEDPSPMELITYLTNTTVLTTASGKPRAYIRGAVVENFEFAYIALEAPPPPPPAEKEKDLFYYLSGGNQSGFGSSNSGYGRGSSITVGACPNPNIININKPNY